MADKAKTLKLKVGDVHNMYLPKLNILYKMQRGSLLLTLKIRKMRDEIDAKMFAALASVREADALRKEAKTEKEKLETETRFQNQLTVVSENEIEINSSKIPFSLLPDESVLAAGYSEPVSQPNGQITYIQGDYITIVSDLYGILIEEDEKLNEKLKG